MLDTGFSKQSLTQGIRKGLALKDGQPANFNLAEYTSCIGSSEMEFNMQPVGQAVDDEFCSASCSGGGVVDLRPAEPQGGAQNNSLQRPTLDTKAAMDMVQGPWHVVRAFLLVAGVGGKTA